MNSSQNPSHTGLYRPATQISTKEDFPLRLPEAGATMSHDLAAKTRNGFGSSNYHSIDMLKGYVETSTSEFLDQARRMISTKQVPYSKVLKSKRKAPK